MKTTAGILLTVALSLAIVVSAQQPQADWRARSRDIRALRASLAQTSLYDFCTNSTGRRPAPLVHSQCHVDWLQDADEKAFEQEKRAWGLDVVGRLEPLAMSCLEPADTATWERKADELLAVAEWIGKTPGYGNFILKRWTEDIACIAIGHLVVDLNYPVNRIQPLLDRIGSVRANLRIQFAILDDEAPHRFTRFAAEDSSEAYQKMYVQWQARVAEARRYYRAQGREFPVSFAETRDAPHEVAFYRDDTGGRAPFTVRSMWDGKNHFMVCGNGCCDDIAMRLRKLFLFREKIGSFPSKPSRPLGLYDSPVREAFYEKWSPYEKQYGRISGNAEQSYTEIMNNQFMDFRTRELKAANQTGTVRGRTSSRDSF